MRLNDIDLDSLPEARKAVVRYLHANPGSERYFELIERFMMRQFTPDLFRIATQNPQDNQGVQSARLLLRLGDVDRFRGAIDGDDPQIAEAAVTVLGFAGDPSTGKLLASLPTDAKRPLAIRRAAAEALGRNTRGEQQLLEMVQGGTLPEDLNFTVANILYASSSREIRKTVAGHLTLPESAQSEPLPPLAKLVLMRGDPNRGKTLFETTATCAKCHVVREKGKQVGPDLSEIGSKLSREALFVDILDPSAGINHDYETYTVVLADGNLLTGIKTSDTNDAVTITTSEAIVHEIKRSNLEEMIKQNISLMPKDLQKTISVQDLIDVVEYLTTLKKEQ